MDGIASSLLDKVSTLTDKVSELKRQKIFQEKGGEENFLPEDLTSDILRQKQAILMPLLPMKPSRKLRGKALLPEGDAGELLSKGSGGG